MKDFKLDQIQSIVASGMDSFFESEPQMVTPLGQEVKTAAVKPRRVKIGSLVQLNGFERVSSETLIHKSTKDLWAIKKEGDDFYIERLFQDTGNPLKV